MRRLAHFRRQDAVFDQEHVGVETRPFVPRPHLHHNAVDGHRLAAGQLPPKRDHIVEL